MRFLKNISTFRTSVLALALLLFIGFGKLNGQPVISMEQNLCCENTTELISVDVSDFEDIGSFTFFVQIDTLLVDFVALVNTHALLGSSVIANFQYGQSRIAISWFSLAGITIEEGNLFDLKLNYHQGNAALNFEDCEISDPDGTVLEGVEYENGSLLPALEIAVHPQSQSTITGEQVQFNIVLQNVGTQELLWQEYDGLTWHDLTDDDTYSGVLTSALTIDNVPLEFNNLLYRCRVNYPECSVFSDEALLNVLPLTIVNKEKPGQKIIDVFPNPFANYFKYEIENSNARNYHFRLFSLNGEPVFDIFVPSSSGIISTKNLESGMYFLQVSGDESSEFVKLLKH